MSSLLATNPMFESIEQAVRSGGESSGWVILTLCGIGLALLLLMAARSSNRQEEPTAGPKIDYLTVLVDVLGLSEEDRRDLKKIGAIIGLEHPASILLSPANLAHAVHHPRLGPPQPELIARMNVLSYKLFDRPLPEPAHVESQ